MSNQQHPPRNAPSQGITKEQIIAHALELLQKNGNPEPENQGLFLIRTGSQWMQAAATETDARMLFGEFWYEGELCILFADTNLGKSILAVQIADSISRGTGIRPFTLQAPKQRVIYLDFELTKKQFQNRYKSGLDEPYQWADEFLRAEVNPDDMPPDEKYSFEDYLSLALEKAVVDSKTRILIIDNLTYLRNETEKAKDALPLMKHLKQLKSKHSLSILALAHTPKRDASRAITRNDLQGSKMLMNFCDSAFSIGESRKDKSMRYLKQIKQRNTAEVYGADNVCLFQVVKPDRFLMFDFIDHGQEWDHLKEPSEEDREALKLQAADLKGQGRSIREIATLLQLSKSKVARMLA